MQNPAYKIQVRYAVELVKQLLPEVDSATSLVLVGDLSQCRPDGLEGIVREAITVENPLFRESHGRLSIPLTGANKYQLKTRLLHRVGLRSLITELQLERYGRLLFHAPNQFKDPVQLSNWFRPHFIEELVHDGIITLTEATVQEVSSVRERPFRFRFAYQ